MMKTVKSVLILCLAAVFGSFIALETLGFRSSPQEGGSASASGAEQTERVDGMPSAEEEERSESLTFTAEPDDEEIVTVIIGVEGAPLLEIANERGESLAELYAGFDGAQLLSARNAAIDRAMAQLSPMLLGTGYRYTGVFNGFSAKVRYGNVKHIEKSSGVESVILSRSYESPQAITENDVNVQDTGIFNSVGVGYDGTGTVVAVLDTGTDYTHEVFDMTLDANTLALTKDDVAARAPLLAATSMSAALEEPLAIDEDDLYMTAKLPYGFDYADIDTDVYPAEAHGTHVAGIIGGESWRIRGVAPRTQIATFKVFKDTGSSTSEGILAAVNDAVVLGVDAINMSLGASCGFSREEDEPYINDVYGLVEASGVGLVVAAGNEYSSSYGGANGNTNLASNPDAGTVGSPASYNASFAVASVSGIKTPYFIANGEKEIYFSESRTTGKTKPNNLVNELLGDKDSGEYQYVIIPGVGYEANYTGIDVSGKIAVIKRGSNSFEDKVKIALSRGAVAAIIYNNLSGMLNMSIGTVNRLPSCLVSMDYGKYFEEHPTGTIHLQKDYLAGPFMSDFSSWGPLADLELVPDITGHGGDITSSFPGRNEYDTISGTSMACPNIAGALVLVRQYVKNMEGARTTPEVRTLSYDLMMSTATIARNEEGNPYSPRKQGAGIGDILRSVTTKAYISVEGSNKAKLNLKDDPTRSGVYEMKFNVTNLSGDSLSYHINPIVMTESMSSDGKTVAEKAYMLSPTSTYSVKANKGTAVVEGATVNLGGYAEAELTVTVRLSGADKDYLNRNFANGMYVEGYIELQSYNPDGIDLHLPYLGFYGNWEDAPMLDVSAYEVGESAVDSSVLEEDKLVADVYGTLPMAGFDMTDDYGNPEIGSWGLGAFGYNIAQGYEQPVTRERYASLTHNMNGNYMLYAIGAGLFRNAKRVDMEIRDSVTGDLIWSAVDYNARKSHSSGGDQMGGSVLVEFNVNDYNVVNNGKYTFNMTCYLDWKREGDTDYTRGNRNTFSFDFYIDDEKPVLRSTYVRDDTERHRKTLEFNVYDNHYLQGYYVYSYEGLDANGDPTGLIPISNGVVPIYNGEFNGTTRVSLDVTSYWSAIQKNGGKLYVQFMDYAKNAQQYFLTLEECDDLKLEKTRNARDEYSVRPNGQYDLKQYVRIFSNVEGNYTEGYWTKDLVWESSQPSVAVVQDGLVVGKTAGQTVITVRPADGATGDPLTFTINVSGDAVTPTVREVELSDYSLHLERGEEAKLTAKIKPYDYDGTVKLSWSSSSANVRVTPDPDDPFTATVKALKSGSASISVRVDGTYINASCSVRVQEEYYVDSVYLNSYTGRGDENGVVEIPDDLGIAYIYPMAFLNNPYITKIIIPEGVQYIMRAGIYGCDRLEEIVLPESCTQLQTFSVAWNPKLKKINTEHVQTIGSRAFIFDTSLEEIDLSRATYISDMAFTYCTALRKVDLSKVGTVGMQAFQGCTSLTELVIPENTSTAAAAFYMCTGLRRLTIYGNHIGAGSFAGCTALESVTFAGDVDVIEAQAFQQCTSLTTVNFLGSVYEIGMQAFAYDTALTSFTLPAGLTKLGTLAFVNSSYLSTIYVDKDACIIEPDLAAFYGLPSLTAFRVEAGNKYLSSDAGILYDKPMMRLIAFPHAKSVATFKVPDTVRVIGPSSFTLIEGVSTIDLNNVERVEDNAFAQCAATFTGGQHITYIGEAAFVLTSLTSFPISSATYIGNEAFEGCTGLTDTALVIPDSVEYLGDFAFMATPITSLKLGNGLKSVGQGAFMNCTALSDVDLGDSLEEISDGMFGACTALQTIELPASVTRLGVQAFRESGLRSINLPAGITEIPEECFYGTAITSVTKPMIPSVTEVGARAFGNTELASFPFLNIKKVGDGAFEGTALTGVQAPNLTEVGASAFAYSNVTTVQLPSVTSIGNSAFAHCEALTTVTLPLAASASRELSVGARAFDGCTALNKVTAPSVTSLGDYAFRGDEDLTELSLPALTTLGANAFSGTGITAIELPNLQTVAEQAFAGATRLAAITVPEYNRYFRTDSGVLYQKNSGNFYTLVAYPLAKTGTAYTVLPRTVKIGAYAFAENPNLTSIVLPEHLKSIGAGAFYHANRLERITVGAVAAPTLESVGRMYGDDIENTYNNFPAELGKTFSLQWIVPKNATGYDSYIWTQYLGNKVQRTDENAINASALDFIDRVNALGSLSGEARTAEVTLLKRIYNLLDSTQKEFVNGKYDGNNYYTKLQAADGASFVETAESAAVSAETANTAPEEGASPVAAALLGVAAAVAAAGALFFVTRKNSGRREK